MENKGKKIVLKILELPIMFLSTLLLCIIAGILVVLASPFMAIAAAIEWFSTDYHIVSNDDLFDDYNEDDTYESQRPN